MAQGSNTLAETSCFWWLADAVATGASMLGSSAAKVAIFSPEALQPPGAGFATAVGSFLQAVSDAVLERAARALQVGAVKHTW
jgi:hypothetical protein